MAETQSYRPDFLDMKPTLNKVSDSPPTYIFSGYTMIYQDGDVIIALDDGRTARAPFFVEAFHAAHAMSRPNPGLSTA